MWIRDAAHIGVIVWCLHAFVHTVYNKVYKDIIKIRSITLAAELETPCVTLRIRPPTFPYLISSDTPSVTSLSRPIGFPKKSTEPSIWAA